MKLLKSRHKKLVENRETSKKQLKVVNAKLDRLDRRVSMLEQTVQVYRREV